MCSSQKMFQRSRFSMKPSKINYTCSAMGLADEDIDSKVNKKFKNFSVKKNVPKLQVFSQNGHYFTLNNTELHWCRALEKQGDITTVSVKMISKNKVPESVRKSLVPDEGPPGKRCVVVKPGLDTCQKSDERGFEDKDTDSVTSINLDSDAESVDSIPDPYLCSSPESSTDASTDSDLGEDVESAV